MWVTRDLWPLWTGRQHALLRSRIPSLERSSHSGLGFPWRPHHRAHAPLGWAPPVGCLQHRGPGAALCSGRACSHGSAPLQEGLYKDSVRVMGCECWSGRLWMLWSPPGGCCIQVVCGWCSRFCYYPKPPVSSAKRLCWKFIPPSSVFFLHGHFHRVIILFLEWKVIILLHGYLNTSLTTLLVKWGEERGIHGYVSVCSSEPPHRPPRNDLGRGRGSHGYKKRAGRGASGGCGVWFISHREGVSRGNSRICITVLTIQASLVAQVVKNLPAVWGTRVQSLGWEDPLEEVMATHSSILAWGIPWTEEPGGPQAMGSQRVGHNWRD